MKHTPHITAPTVTFYASLAGEIEPWGDTQATLADAAIDYTEGRHCAHDMTVWAQHSDGALIDVTHDADAMARKSFTTTPDWMLTDDERDEDERDAMLDAQHDRDERFSWEQV